jgi:hypothetical protein
VKRNNVNLEAIRKGNTRKEVATRLDPGGSRTVFFHEAGSVDDTVSSSRAVTGEDVWL